MKRFLKISTTEWINENRDKRELEVAKKLGFEVIVMAKGKVDSYFDKDTSSGFTVFRFSTRPMSKINFKSINRIVSYFQWAKYAKSFNADILSCHNYLALGIGYLSTLNCKKHNKPILIYDSHEFEIGRAGANGKLRKWLVYIIEHYLIKRTDLNIMVNDLIAQKVYNIHHLSQYPLVVRNIPYYWTLDWEVIKRVRENFFLSLPNFPKSDHSLVIMSHGSITKYRGFEDTLRVVALVPDSIGVILGNGDETYIQSLKNIVRELKIENRVLFHSAVKGQELWKYVGAADIGMILTEPITINNYLASPNKFFECIQAMTPVICSDLPVMADIINKYRIGYVVDRCNVKAIAKIIIDLQRKKNIKEKFYDNLRKAKNELKWEIESKLLEESYKKWAS